MPTGRHVRCQVGPDGSRIQVRWGVWHALPQLSQAHLFVLPAVIEKWLSFLPVGKHRIVFGFYIPRNLSEYRSIYNGGSSKFVVDVDRIEISFALAIDRASKREVRPILVACYDGPTVTCDSMLPIGIWCGI